MEREKAIKIVRAALKEDIGLYDITASSVVPRLERVKASIVTTEACVLCGMDIAKWAMNAVDAGVRFKPKAKDGRCVPKGQTIAFLEGHARSVLSAERTMLNFLCFLSGIATKVNKFAGKVKKYGVKIYDTRKTFPLLRYLEKYAVEVGGGFNHRFGLWDQVLIKENHLKAISYKLSAISHVLKDIRRKVHKNIKIEIEVSNLKEFKEAIKGKPDIIMLDNMRAPDIKKAVKLKNSIRSRRKPVLEVSGGIALANIEKYAKTGIDRISVGSLTDSVESIDMALEIIG